MGFFQDERHIVFAVFGCQCLSCGNINFIVTDVFSLFVLSVISHQGLTFTDINIVVNLGQVFSSPNPHVQENLPGVALYRVFCFFFQFDIFHLSDSVSFCLSD